jgi:mutator protein MutT
MKVVDVAAALLFRDGKLLITQRPDGSHLAGLWEFPGGKRESNETFEECLVREMQEELGVEVEVGRLIDTVVHTYPEKTVRLKFFKVAWLKNEPRPIGCPAFRWVGPDELQTFRFPEADASLLEKLRASPDWGTPSFGTSL